MVIDDCDALFSDKHPISLFVALLSVSCISIPDIVLSLLLCGKTESNGLSYMHESQLVQSLKPQGIKDDI